MPVTALGRQGCCAAWRPGGAEVRSRLMLQGNERTLRGWILAFHRRAHDVFKGAHDAFKKAQCALKGAHGAIKGA
eukprot:1152272-Pelagomonas_calceolata.AAC.4